LKSEVFSNKNNYPNLISDSSPVTGEHFLALLNHLGVRRIAIVAGPENAGGVVMPEAVSIRNFLIKSNIDVVAYLTIPFRVIGNDKLLKPIFDILKSAKAFYILILAGSITTADFYFSAGFVI
jgi:hypothetical protein